MHHRGRQLSPYDLEQFDFILAMDQSNYQDILSLENASLHTHKIMLMRKFDPAGTSVEVPDPYYGDERDFQEVFEILDRSIQSFIQHLEGEHLNA